MMRSLYSGVAGLKTHQTRMDVIGNNISNVNTVSYKSQTVNFSDMLYQTTSAASGPNSATGAGGTNARQIGLGVKTAAVSTAITTAGAAQTTNNPFDILITGESFFVVNDGNSNFFTRDGSFNVDASGNLVMSSTGYRVMGWQTDATTGAIRKDTVSPLTLMSSANMTYPAEATTNAYFAGIVDKNDTDVTSTAGKTVNLKIYDSLGYSYTAKFTITRDTAADTTGTPAYAGYKVALSKILDSEGNEVTTNPPTFTATDIFFSKTDGSFGGVTTAGTLTSKTATLTSASGNFKNVSIDFSALTNVNNEGTSTVTASNGTSSSSTVGSGRAVGNMTGVSIQKDGLIYATYDNGQSKLLGQIATASFANAAGLAKDGDNLYSATQNSGAFDGIGQDVTSDGGYFTTGELEMSNVDLSSELTSMIVTQRGFQANSRIITVSDSMLEELVNLKRN